MLVNALEHPLDHGILRFIEFPDFAAPPLAVELVFGDESGLEGVWVCVLRSDIDGRDFGVVRVSPRALGEGCCCDGCHCCSWVSKGEAAWCWDFHDLRWSSFWRIRGVGPRDWAHAATAMWPMGVRLRDC
jgi:hypothetical protein